MPLFQPCEGGSMLPLSFGICWSMSFDIATGGINLRLSWQGASSKLPSLPLCAHKIPRHLHPPYSIHWLERACALRGRSTNTGNRATAAALQVRAYHRWVEFSFFNVEGNTPLRSEGVAVVHLLDERSNKPLPTSAMPPFPPAL